MLFRIISYVIVYFYFIYMWTNFEAVVHAYALFELLYEPYHSWVYVFLYIFALCRKSEAYKSVNLI